jgi:uncharacterized membrane protein YjfL (UPF0719 family)
LFFRNPLSRQVAAPSLAWMVTLLSGATILSVLMTISSHDVRDNPLYIFFYMVMWLGWTGIWNRIMPYLGLSCRDDALERGNTAAALAVCGGLLGVTLIFAGGNIGEGPGWWVVVFCAANSTVAMLVLWLIDNRISHVIEAITIDRDTAAGWRAAGFFISAGLILGRAIAGDWHSVDQTMYDFVRLGWPVLILWGIAMALDVLCHPTPERPAPDRLALGVLPFLVFVAAGVGDVLLRGLGS